MKYLVSVIVPVYKVEKYLEKCVESIRNQTYQNLEIILVDDGSPDNCPKMCDELAKKDTRIKVVHKQNGGLSSARNAGIDIAKGDFIAFVDSDDWVEKDYISTMLRKQKEYGADLVCCSICDVIESTGEKIPHPQVKKDLIIEKKNIFKEYYKNFKTNLTVAWNKLYKKSIFKKLRYVEGRIYEDVAMVLPLLGEVENVVLIPDVLYNYFRIDDSITGTNYSKEKVDSLIKNFDERVLYVKKHCPKFVRRETTLRLNDLGWVCKESNDKEIFEMAKKAFLERFKNGKKSFSPLHKATYSMIANFLYVKSKVAGGSPKRKTNF